MPRHIVPKTNRRFAKTMRQALTPAELRLWMRLRKPGIPGQRFRRQTPIGPYIVDFFCPERRIIVEVDGDQHGYAVAERKDAQRDAWLRSRGYVVIRVGNRDVFSNIDGVCETIIAVTTRAK
jgi:very-short-patch-repair endonuclease